MRSGVYRFGDYTFDTESGELRSGGDSPTLQRLQPQPARLLALLIDKRGELLTREEIREGIWGGVEVDFDRSLHFCVRQVRAALGDSGTAPRYVETLPRRGYRLLPGVEPGGGDGTGRATGGTRGTRKTARIVVATVIVLLLATVVLRFGRGTASVERPTRIGIMPFASPQATAFVGSTAIADQLLENLTPRAGARAEIVGPTTTQHFERAIRELAVEYRLDYVINGRFILDDGNPRLLGELIRVSDGAHIWVRPFTEDESAQSIGLAISDATVRTLELAE